MKINKFRLLLQVIFVAVLLGVFLAYPKQIMINGETMGTTYQIKAYVPFWRKQARIQQLITHRLDQLNQVFSTYISDSDLAKFNANQTNDVQEINHELFILLKTGKTLYQKSDGAWDASILPLYRLWGFMREGTLQKLPSETKIQGTLQKIGYDKLKFVGPNRIQKKQPKLALDLSSIAKGYAVDELTLILKRLGSQHFLVEIGGEIRVAGQRNRDEKWRVGINVPKADSSLNAVAYTVELFNQAMATSGDYRNFHQINNKRYSHILDPRTGYPVKHQTVSATVIAESCLLADALATAAMVLSPKEALALIKQNKKAELLLIEKVGNDYKTYMTDGFKKQNLKAK